MQPARSISKRTKECQENAPCCVLEVLQPSAVWQFALVSLSLPVPSVLNIRRAAKQHNVVQLTCSSHNLALSATLSIWSICLRSRTRAHARLFLGGGLNYQALSRQTQLFSSSLLLLPFLPIFSRWTFSTLCLFPCRFSLPGNIRTHFWPFN